MGSDTKVNISLDELIVLLDTNFFHTKKALTDKIYQLFGELAEVLKEDEIVQNYPYPAGTDCSMGKISKGENYRDLPYIILDLPRLFTNDSVFACRTMMWWGHHFSFTLHISGRAFAERKSAIQSNLVNLKNTATYICTGTNEWEHHFEEDNYQLLDEVEDKQLEKILNRTFIKLSRKLELKDHHRVAEFGVTTYKDYLKALGV